MTTYNVTVIDRCGWVKTFKTTSLKDIAKLRKEALENARKCLPFSLYDKRYRHLVYYYELKSTAPWEKNTVDVRINFQPDLVDDKQFYDFVDYWKPIFTGAIHKHD